MECPFCREQIKDGAVVCRYCGREWSLAKPHMELAAALQAERDALKLELDAARRALLSLQTQPQGRIDPWKDRRMFLATVAGAAVIYLALNPIGNAYESRGVIGTEPAFLFFMLVLTLGVPVATGFLLGYLLTQRHIGRYVVAGLVVAPVGLFSNVLFDNVGFTEVMVFSGGVLFLTLFGGLIGDWVRRHFARGNDSILQPTLARAAAEQIVGARAATSPDGTVRIERWTKILTPLVPIVVALVGLLGTVITATIALTSAKAGHP